jgi:hypothetical protein
MLFFFFLKKKKCLLIEPNTPRVKGHSEEAGAIEIKLDKYT